MVSQQLWGCFVVRWPWFWPRLLCSAVRGYITIGCIGVVVCTVCGVQDVTVTCREPPLVVTTCPHLLDTTSAGFNLLVLSTSTCGELAPQPHALDAMPSVQRQSLPCDTSELDIPNYLRRGLLLNEPVCATPTQVIQQFGFYHTVFYFFQLHGFIKGKQTNQNQTCLAVPVIVTV